MNQRSSRQQATTLATAHGTTSLRGSPSLKFALLGGLITTLATGALISADHLPVLSAVLIGINVGTFFLCGFDKSIAKGKATRVPELILLSFALVGGTPGLIGGMVLFRHKTMKSPFILKLSFVVLLQLLVLRSGAVGNLFAAHSDTSEYGKISVGESSTN